MSNRPAHRRHGLPMPNGQEKANARKVIANAQQEAQRIAQMESGLMAAAGKIEAYRRLMFLFINGAPGQQIRVPQTEIDRVFKDEATAKTSVFEVDAESEPGFILYRIPTAETMAQAERVKSMMEHADESAKPPENPLGGFTEADRQDMANGTFEQAAPPTPGEESPQ